jgi:hypothetical protein
LENPLQISLINRDSRTVDIKCLSKPANYTGPIIQQAQYQSHAFSGAWAQSTLPFIVRAYVTFMGNYIDVGNVNVQVWDATNDVCSFFGTASNPPVPLQESQTAVPTSSSYPIQIENIPITDINGNSTGQFTTVSYVDIPISVPSTVQGVYVFAQIIYNGYGAVGSLFYTIGNPLSITVNAAVPIANGISVAEELANVTLINPNTGEVSGSVPNGTVVSWSIIPVNTGAKMFPFYSTDKVPNSAGQILSYVNNGQAQDVFFGPASNIVLTPVTSSSNSAYGSSSSSSSSSSYSPSSSSSSYGESSYSNLPNTGIDGGY